MRLKERFVSDVKNVEVPHVLVVAVKLPTGSVETITNYHGLGAKIDYYMNQYDDEFKLKATNSIQIVGYMLV